MIKRTEEIVVFVSHEHLRELADRLQARLSSTYEGDIVLARYNDIRIVLKDRRQFSE